MAVIADVNMVGYLCAYVCGGERKPDVAKEAEPLSPAERAAADFRRRGERPQAARSCVRYLWEAR